MIYDNVGLSLLRLREMSVYTNNSQSTLGLKDEIICVIGDTSILTNERKLCFIKNIKTPYPISVALMSRLNLTKTATFEVSNMFLFYRRWKINKICIF